MGQDHALTADVVAGVVREGGGVEHDFLDVGNVESVGHTQQAPYPVESHAGLEISLEGVDNVRQVSRVECACLGLDRQQYLLLPGRSPEVAVDVVVARSNVLAGIGPIE